ncbi:MAG: DUF4412 domain-containing protein [Campylobacterota bacterium]|nr:DUF4412 domain-containing protein [Campylobacterota bacterium]
MLKTLLILPLLGASLLADLTITSNADGDIEKTYYKDGKMLVVSTEGKSIFDTKKQMITVILDQHKIYLQDSMESYAKNLGQTTKNMQNAMQQQMREAMLARGMDEAQVTMMLERMKQSMDAQPQLQDRPKPIVKKTGTAKVAGYSCDTYSIVDMVEQFQEEECLSPEVDKLVSREIDINVMIKMGKQIQKSSGDAQDPLENKGFPMRTRDMSYGQTQIVSEVTLISKKSIDSNLFAIPKGYKKTTTKEFYSKMMKEQMR